MKANPNKLSFGSPGVGTSVHVSGELFKSMTGTAITHVPYKGSAPAVTDLIAGQVQVMFDNTPNVLPQVKAGKLKALGVSSRKRSDLAPDVPTVDEAGVPGYEVSVWFGILAPAATPEVTPTPAPPRPVTPPRGLDYLSSIGRSAFSGL